MQNELVTVFGASGFVGRHAVRALAKEGYRIRAICRRPNLANFLLPAGQVGQIQLVKGNINNDDDVAAAVAGASAVVNATGVLYGHGRQGFESIHADASGRIARAALAAGVTTLVHISALGADTEADSAYARSKGLGERNMREAFPRVTILRPSLVFGPEDSFFNHFAGLAHALAGFRHQAQMTVVQVAHGGHKTGPDLLVLPLPGKLLHGRCAGNNSHDSSLTGIGAKFTPEKNRAGKLRRGQFPSREPPRTW